MNWTAIIDRFSGQYRFLSNFYPAAVEFEGDSYPTTEHAFQAAKTLDPVERRRFRKAGTPGDAKKLGREVTLRDDWKSVKIEIMTDLVRQKFTNHSVLKKQLLSTKSAKLVEGNTWGDQFWGVCGGKGSNHLGKILMMIREELNG